MASDSLILFHDAPMVLWDELSVSQTSWVVQEVFLDVSGADNVFASKPKNDSVELPPLSGVDFSIDFNVYSADVIQISDDVPSCLENGVFSCDGDSTKVEQTDAVVGIVWGEEIVVTDDVNDMGIVWGEDIDVDDIPEGF